MSVKQLKPVKTVRDNYGQWIHPELSKYWNDNFGSDAEWVSKEQLDELKRYFNIETTKFYLETSVSSDVWEEMMDSCNITDWNPVAPQGFFLIDIYFTEDDAVAIFAKKRTSV